MFGAGAFITSNTGSHVLRKEHFVENEVNLGENSEGVTVLGELTVTLAQAAASSSRGQ